METQRIRPGAMLAQTVELLRGAPALSLAALIILVGLDTVSDQMPVDSTLRFQILPGILSIAFQLYVTRALLDHLRLRDPVKGGGFWMMIGLGIVSGLGIILGLLLLVVPGIILLVRWSLATPILIARGGGSGSVLRESWDVTRGQFWPVLATLLIVYAPAIVAGLTVIFADEALTTSLPASIPLNLLLEVSIILGWHLQVALYSAIGVGEERIADVFA